MRFKRWRPIALALLLVAAAGTARPDDAVADDVIQVIAGVTAIQVLCRNLEVRPGVAFQYGESLGVRLADILPGGKRRAEFDAAFAKVSMIQPAELCSSLAAKYESDLPGVIGRK